jgi:hypothetical protein
MSDLHAREASPDDWEDPVVELLEDGRVVGIVYLDGETLYAEFSPDEDGDPWAFETADLQRALDTAAAMLLPDTSLISPGPAPAAGGEHPVDVLAGEFDDTAVHRGDEDEGFYPPRTAARLIQRAEVLGLAVVSMEGCRIEGGEVLPVSGLSVDIGEAHDGEPWPMFLAGSNVQAMALVERWARERDLVISIEVGDDDGERYLL